MHLGREFYARPTLEVARDLLGKHLRVRHGARQRGGRIVETEAYCGPEDRASHASKGRTERTALMFGAPGYAYVYLVYGVHHCLNIVTEPEGYPAAVLLRALEAPPGSPPMNGPGRLCRALGIDLSWNGTDLCGDRLFVEDRGEPPPAWRTSPRIGVEYAGHWAKKPWRFFIEGSGAVSGARPARRRE